MPKGYFLDMSRDWDCEVFLSRLFNRGFLRPIFNLKSVSLGLKS